MNWSAKIQKQSTVSISAAGFRGRNILGHNSIYIWIVLAVSVVQFILFKLLYPFPDFISDSYSYITAELLNLNVNLWPIGYSRYLSLIHAISHSDTFLVFTQYFLIQCSLLYLFYTTIGVYKFSRISRNVFFIGLFLNPIFIYLSNCVLSDALFSAISIVWFTQLVKTIRQPHFYQVLTTVILVGVLFTIRYTAVYYPLVAAVAFLLSKHNVKAKMLGIAGPYVIIIPFVLYTEKETKAITGTAEFSVFGGWQIANNALYMYDHIKLDPSSLPNGTEEIDGLVRRYFKVVPPEYRELEPYPGTFFIKMSNAPLKVYMHAKFTGEDNTGGLLSWGTVSPIYSKYGIYLIKTYPIEFVRYYLWLNAKNYFIPHLEKFGRYNLDMDSVWWPAVTWFQYNSPAVRVVDRDLQKKIFAPYPVFFLMFNVLFLGCIIIFIYTGTFRRSSPFVVRSVSLAMIFLILNFAFSIFATPVVLRYQIVPMIFLFAFSIVLIEELESAFKLKE